MKKSFLLFGALLISSGLLAKNLVLTSIQPTYSIAKHLTKNTTIRVESVFGSDTSMDMARESMNGESFKMPKENADAVIDISKLWIDDNLFEKLRKKNIHTVEIDASYPYDEEKSTLFFSYDDQNKVIPYVWMGTKNLIRMASIITKDLISLYPQERKRLEKNLVEFNAMVIKMEQEGNETFLSSDNVAVISLSPNIRYFLNDFNIYAEEIDPEKITEENVAKIMEEKGIKVFASDRWLKKKVIKAIEAAGGSFVVLNTLNIPMDKDGKMDEEALFKSYKANIDALHEAFQK